MATIPYMKKEMEEKLPPEIWVKRGGVLRNMKANQMAAVLDIIAYYVFKG